MPARLLRLLSVRPDHLDALVSEQAVKDALVSTPGVFIPSFGLWAVRQQALRKHNPKIREWLPPKVWTWRAFSPQRPQDLSLLDQQALAHLATGLHGLMLVKWTVDDQHLTFTRWPLRAVRVGTRWALQPQPYVISVSRGCGMAERSSADCLPLQEPDEQTMLNAPHDNCPRNICLGTCEHSGSQERRSVGHDAIERIQSLV